MRYVYFNPNPENKLTGDCVVRAFCVALDTDWDDAFTRLCARAFALKDMPSSNNVWDRQLLSEGFYREILPFDRNYTVIDFCKDHPYGTFVLGTCTHAIGVKDGKYYDAWDSGYEIPTYFYRKEI